MIKSASDHLRQADHNEHARTALLQAPGMDDWRVTTTFYAALHRVRAHFQASGLHVPSSHSKMRIQIARHVPEIANAYDKLYALSLRARYTEGMEIGAEQEDEAVGFYAQVVEGMRRRMGEQGAPGGHAS